MVGLPSQLLKNIMWNNNERSYVVNVIVKYTVQSNPLGNPLGFSMLAFRGATEGADSFVSRYPCQSPAASFYL